MAGVSGAEPGFLQFLQPQPPHQSSQRKPAVFDPTPHMTVKTAVAQATIITSFCVKLACSMLRRDKSRRYKIGRAGANPGISAETLDIQAHQMPADRPGCWHWVNASRKNATYIQSEVQMVSNACKGLATQNRYCAQQHVSGICLPGANCYVASGKVKGAAALPCIPRV